MPTTPSATNQTRQRTLRSDSNSNNSITLNDIKLLIENSKVEILSSLKKEIDGLNSVLTKLNKRVEEVERRNSHLEHRCKQLEENYASLPAEFEERDRRKPNLIISGIPEKEHSSSEERKQWDEEMSTNLFQSLGTFTKDAISRTYRIGKEDPSKPRLLRVTCRDVHIKRAIVERAVYLRNMPRYVNVYISPDRTPMEQRDYKQLREELKRRRILGEDVIIRHGKIVSRLSFNDKAVSRKQSFQ